MSAVRGTTVTVFKMSLIVVEVARSKGLLYVMINSPNGMSDLKKTAKSGGRMLNKKLQ